MSLAQCVEPGELEALFDHVPNVLFFIKDSDCRYTHVNVTIVQRLGLKSRHEVIGKCVEDVYPGGLSVDYARQDRQVLAGEVIENRLELQLFPNREPGWCLTHKRPLRDQGRICGIVGISRDLGPQEDGGEYERLRLALAWLNGHYAEQVRVQTLMDITGFSLSKLERSFRRVFQLPPQQLLTKLRIQMAMDRLGGDERVAGVGQACGFVDQSSFTRQFKVITGMTPSEYRGRHAAGERMALLADQV